MKINENDLSKKKKKTNRPRLRPRQTIIASQSCKPWNNISLKRDTVALTWAAVSLNGVTQSYIKETYLPYPCL